MDSLQQKLMEKVKCSLIFTNMVYVQMLSPGHDCCDCDHGCNNDHERGDVMAIKMMVAMRLAMVMTMVMVAMTMVLMTMVGTS